MNKIISLVTQSAKDSIYLLIGALYFIMCVILLVGPGFAIAALADMLGAGWLILFVPYILLLPLMVKPLEKFYK